MKIAPTLSKDDIFKKIRSHEHLYLDRFRVGLFELCNNLTVSDSKPMMQKIVQDFR